MKTLRLIINDQATDIDIEQLSKLSNFQGETNIVAGTVSLTIPDHDCKTFKRIVYTHKYQEKNFESDDDIIVLYT